MKVLDGIDDIAICRLTGQDVVRHRLVQEIIDAYERFETNRPGKNDNDFRRQKKQ